MSWMITPQTTLIRAVGLFNREVWNHTWNHTVVKIELRDFVDLDDLLSKLFNLSWLGVEFQVQKLSTNGIYTGYIKYNKFYWKSTPRVVVNEVLVNLHILLSFCVFVFHFGAICVFVFSLDSHFASRGIIKWRVLIGNKVASASSSSSLLIKGFIISPRHEIMSCKSTLILRDNFNTADDRVVLCWIYHSRRASPTADSFKVSRIPRRLVLWKQSRE